VRYDREDLASGRVRWTDLTPAEWRDYDERGVAELKATGIFQPFEKEYFRKDGSRVPVLLGGALFEGSGNEGVAFVLDLSDQKRSEEALGRARSELAHVTRVASLGALTASIAHEVNQPLSGIISNASACLRMLDADPPNVAGACETVRRTIRDANRASEVITRLRALFSNRETSTEAVDLNEATREVIALSLSELQRNQVMVRTELTDDLPPVSGDRVQLQQVILNLLHNASEAMSAVHDRPRQLVIRTAPDEGDHVRLTVRDAGVGFEHGLDKVFEGFYSTKSGGMGIGLSVSRSIIERHHGRLWATPNDGPGTTFAFSIPRSPEGDTDAGIPDAVRTP
jgi:C4-dicarboxylate-specific signal transduction histidine kinase